MSVPVTLLGLLEREPSHGYELKHAYDNFFGRSRPLPFGQVYSTLGRLVRDQKVVPGELEHGDGPDRKLYIITDAGKADVDAWLAEPMAAEPYLQPVLFTKIVLALMLDRSPDDLLDAQRSTHLQRMRELTEQRRSGSVVDGLLADFALFHLEADLRWIDLTEARMSALTQAVTK
jgi:DNA-binding PadR family transcriptional regulator